MSARVHNQTLDACILYVGVCVCVCVSSHRHWESPWRTQRRWFTHMIVCMHVCMCVCVCVITQTLGEYVEDTEEMVYSSLNAKRNRLIAYDLLFIGINCISMVSTHTHAHCWPGV